MSASSDKALDYLESLNRATHTKLYEQPSTALAIFKCMLPHLAKTLVTAMLYMPGSFALADIDAWFREDGKKYVFPSLPWYVRLTWNVQRTAEGPLSSI